MRLLRYLRPRFTLRTMLVVMTLVCVWCAYGIIWIKQRQSEYAKSDILKVPNPSSLVRNNLALTVRSVGTRKFPLSLLLLGERRYDYIVKPWDNSATWGEEEERLRAIFPEGQIGRLYHEER
jgi:hypothetical protein